MKRETKLKKKQKQFIEIFATKAGCNVSVTCKQLNIGRKTFYLWYNTNEEFKEQIEDARESLIDFAETKLQQNIMNGQEASIFFFLKTIGKKRGYVERQEITGYEGKNLILPKLTLEDIEELKKNNGL